MKLTVLEENDVFQAWECVSLRKKNGTTFDLVIKNMNNLMAFIHVLHRSVYKTSTSRQLHLYKMHKFRMKMEFESWNRGLTMA